MDGIYSQAVATIVALNSLSAASALPGFQRGTTPALATSESIHELGIRVESLRPQHLGAQIHQAPYETRAWTFQERLLSRRCLLFTYTGVYFHCSEELTPMQECQLPDCDPHFNTLPECLLANSSTQPSQASIFFGYAQLVREYTKRHLSYPSDALNAFSGILELFKYRCGGEINNGLLTSIFDVALLWSPVRDAQHCTRNARFPSWSWAGWIQPVMYQPDRLQPLYESFLSNHYRQEHDDFVSDWVKNLRSVIPHFYISGQLVQRNIGRSFINIEQTRSDTNMMHEGPKHFAPQPSGRDILEFDTLAIKLALVPSQQVCLLRKYALTGASREQDDFSADYDLGLSKPGSTDLILLSKFSPLSPYDLQKYISLGYDIDFTYFSENKLEIREHCMLNIMIVVWDADKAYAERAGLYVVHEDIWNQWSPQLKHICLV